MSARGARSRKVQQKDIQKKEKKTIVRGKGPQIDYDQNGDAFVDWHKNPSLNHPTSLMTKSITYSSNVSRGTSHSEGSNNNSSGRSRSRMNTAHSNDVASRSTRQPRTSGSDTNSNSISISVPDQGPKEKEKGKATFEARGKETKAPRGRGGGVPIKRHVNPTPQIFLNDLAASYPSPNQRTWMNFKFWEGGRDELRPYLGFDFVSLVLTITNSQG